MNHFSEGKPMIKLYAFPMSCSYAVHVALIASGLPFEEVWVRWPEGMLSDGRDYRDVNPRLQTPSIEIVGEGLLTETPAILQYIADLAPQAKLAPPNGTFARTRLQEMLNYLSSELHKQVLWTLANIFRLPGDKEAMTKKYLEMLHARLDYLEARLGDSPYLLGDEFSVADPLLHVLLYSATLRTGSLDKWPKLKAYEVRLRDVDAVARAYKINVEERQRLLDAGRPA